MFAEEKTRMGSMSEWFLRFIKEVMHPAIKEYAKKNDIDYRGYHLIQFEHETPDDGKTLLNGKDISKDDLIKFLSMEDAEETKQKNYEEEVG